MTSKYLLSIKETKFPIFISSTLSAGQKAVIPKPANTEVLLQLEVNSPKGLNPFDG